MKKNWNSEKVKNKVNAYGNLLIPEDICYGNQYRFNRHSLFHLTFTFSFTLHASLFAHWILLCRYRVIISIAFSLYPPSGMITSAYFFECSTNSICIGLTVSMYWIITELVSCRCVRSRWVPWVINVKCNAFIRISWKDRTRDVERSLLVTNIWVIRRQVNGDWRVLHSTV